MPFTIRPYRRFPVRLSVLVLVLLTGTVSAEQNQKNPIHGEFEDYLKSQKETKQKPVPTWKEVVEACAAMVRKETNERFHNPASEFDAYIKANDHIAYFGTPKEGFSFQKCMNEMGHPLGDKVN